MYSISDKQIDFILNDIRARGVEMEDLQYNLLDHICCIIENKLEANGDFERFYQGTIKQFYKHELWEIEEETISLQLFKHYYTMKKIMIGSGIFSAITMIAGIIFKFMHWPGAGILIVLGIGLSSLVFLPLLFTLKIKEKKSARDRAVIGIGTLAGILMSLAILFKIMHWPWANMMGMTAIIMMLVVFLPIYFFSGIRNPETKVNTVVSSIIIIMGCGLFLALVNSRPSIKVQNSIAFSSKHINDTYLFISKQNETRWKAIEKDSTVKTESVADLNRKANEICKRIDEIKSNVIMFTEGQVVAPDDYKNIMQPDNFNMPTMYFFNEGKKPKRELQQLRKELVELNVLAATEFKVNGEELINLNNKESVHGEGKEPWEISNFHNTSLALVLQNLSELQLDVRVLESVCYK